MEFGPFDVPEIFGQLKVDADPNTCGYNVTFVAYDQPFNASDISEGYIGDVGYSLDGPYSFAIPTSGITSDEVYIVAQTIDGPASCEFSFVVDFPPSCDISSSESSPENENAATRETDLKD